MASEVDIYNMALMRLGNSSQVSSTSESSPEARACNTFYAQCRDTMLRDFPWGFARRRVSLAQTADTAPTNWHYVFGYPSDCLRLLGMVLPGSRQPLTSQEVPFQLGFNGTNRVIYCDTTIPEAVYTARVVDPTQFDPIFASALAMFLASEIAMPLAVKPDLAGALKQSYALMMNTAAVADASETFLGQEPDGEIVQIRGLGPLYPNSDGPWVPTNGGFTVG